MLAGQRAVRGAGDVGAEESFVQRGRDLGEHRGVAGHDPEEVRAPGSQRDHVDQGQRPVAGAVQQVSAQGHRAPVVMDDQVRLAELPCRSRPASRLACAARETSWPSAIVEVP